MIGKTSAAYIRGRNEYLQLRPSTAEAEPSLELRELHRLGYNDARRQARGAIVQLQLDLPLPQFALDLPEERHENVPFPLNSPEGTP